MSGARATGLCRCANATYARNYAESDSDPDDATDAETRDVKARRSLTDSRIESPVLSRGTSQNSIAVQVLKKVDACRASGIGMQNLKLSLLFPEASPRSLTTSRAISRPPILT